MSPKCTQFWIIPSHLVPMNSVWIPPCCSISISNYSACSVKTLSFSWSPTSSPCPPEVDSLSFFKSFWNISFTFHCYGYSPLSPSCQDYCNYSLTGVPDSVFFFIPSNLFHQAHCSDTLLLPCHSLSQNYRCYILSIIQNLISLFWHASYLPLPCPTGPYLPFCLVFHTTVFIKHPFLPYSIQHQANKSHYAHCHPHICVQISPSISKNPVYFHPSKCTGSLLSSQWFLWPTEPILISLSSKFTAQVCTIIHKPNLHSELPKVFS